jgi:antitoxin CcdA
MPDHRHAESPPLSRTKSVNLNEHLALGAKFLGVDISKAAETEIAQAIKRRKEEEWLVENRPALDSCNAYVQKNGLPLARYRLF